MHACLPQDALAHVLSGIELLPSAPVPAGASHKEQAEQAEEGAEAPAAAGSVPAVRLSQLGLACAVTAASAVQRTPAERGACTPAQLVRKSLNQATATPPNLPARMLPPADECAVSLAQCLERLPALAAMVRQLRETGDTESGVRREGGLLWAAPLAFAPSPAMRWAAWAACKLGWAAAPGMARGSNSSSSRIHATALGAHHIPAFDAHIPHSPCHLFAPSCYSSWRRLAI